MSRWVALLGSINVGRRRVKGPELVAIAESVGLTNVASYQTSGNLIFETDKTGDASESATTKRDTITTSLETALAGTLGYQVVVYLRSIEEINALATSKPFTDEELEGTLGKVQVGALLATPAETAAHELLALGDEANRLKVDGAHWFWLPDEGISSSDLDLKALAKAVGSTTIRTYATIQRLSHKFG